MARPHADERDDTDARIGRRSLLRAAGGAALAVGLWGGVGAASGQQDGSGRTDGTTHSLELAASWDNPDAELNVSVTATGPIEFGDEAEPGTDVIEQHDDGTYTATSVRMNPGAVDTYRFSGALVGYSVTPGYDVTVAVDGTETTFEALVDDGGPADDGSGSDEQREDGSVGDAVASHVIVIDGTDDPGEIAKYDITVSGDIERAEDRSSVGEDSLPWDRMTDYAQDGRAIGVVGNGADAYRFSGHLTGISLDGVADVTLREA